MGNIHSLVIPINVEVCFLRVGATLLVLIRRRISGYRAELWWDDIHSVSSYCCFIKYVRRIQVKMGLIHTIPDFIWKWLRKLVDSVLPICDIQGQTVYIVKYPCCWVLQFLKFSADGTYLTRSDMKFITFMSGGDAKPSDLFTFTQLVCEMCFESVTHSHTAQWWCRIIGDSTLFSNLYSVKADWPDAFHWMV
jgi:hypothetical protein